MPARRPADPAARTWPDDIFSALKSAGVTLIATVPDGGLEDLLARCRADKAMRVVTLTTEEEGIGVLAGAWLGGTRGALLMQSSGVGNCPNALAMAATCRFPCLMIVSMRGEKGEFNPWQVPMARAIPAVFRALNVAVQRIDRPETAGRATAAAAKAAFGKNRATAVVISQRTIGIKSFGK